MSRAALFGLLIAALLGACRQDPEGFPPQDIAGEWNFSANVFAGAEDQCLMSGTLELTQTGSVIGGSAKRYGGFCSIVPVDGPITTATLTESALTLHAGACEFTGYLNGTADSVAGVATCVTTFGTWSGTWQAVKVGAALTITITPGDREIVPGASHPYQATVRDGAGHVLVGQTIVWHSSNTAVATIAELPGGTGAATLAAVGTGSATITVAVLLPEVVYETTAAITVSQPTFTEVVAGGNTACALSTAGAAWCWGSDLINPSSGPFATSPVKVPSPVAFSDITVGLIHACGLTPGGAAWCWGRNAGGPLGAGDTVSSTVPRAVTGGLVFTQITAGTGTTCARTSAGLAYCWGSGPVGNGTMGPVSVPTAVSGGIAFLRLDSWSEHTCGVTAAGAGYCWGENVYGALGNGTTSTAEIMTPAAVTGGLAFASVNPGGISACGLTTAGAAYCWGNGVQGFMGDGSHPVTRTAPGPVSGGHVFSSLDANFDEVCGLKVSGQLWCWGRNFAGGLGDGTQVDRDVPVQVTGGLVFTQVSVGSAFACGMAGGAAYCWGYNQFGSVGDGTTTMRLAPTRVLGQP